MNAPLSRFLVEFSGGLTVAESFPDLDGGFDLDAVEAAPTITVTAEEFEQRLGEARDEADAAARTASAAELTAAFEVERADLLRQFEAEREALTTLHGQTLAAGLTTAMAQLEATLADALATALQPVFGQACQARILRELATTLEALLADPGHPAIRIEGPVELLTAFGDAHGSELAIDYCVCDQAELTIVADGTRIATRLSNCLARISVSEG